MRHQLFVIFPANKCGKLHLDYVPLPLTSRPRPNIQFGHKVYR